MERGRSEYFRSAGITRLAQLDDPEPTAWTLKKVSLEYLRPARIDDLIEVRTRCIGLSGARMTADQMIYKADELLMRGLVEACVITLSGKPRRIASDVRERLLPLLCDTGT
jgi:acyl-CoA thioester hydrolase